MNHLLDICAHLNKCRFIGEYKAQKPVGEEISPLDFVDIRGQKQAKRVLEIVAAGQHTARIARLAR